MNEKTTSELMWETLMSSLTDFIDGGQNSRIQNILHMITTDLTFDDPGLFEQETIYSDELKEQTTACNLWLLNQLIWITTLNSYDGLKKHNLELQKAIVSASFSKQPWFFYSVIVPKYVELLELLNTYDENHMMDIKDFFCVPEYDITKFTQKCSYKTIVFKSVSNLDDIMESCLYVISHAVELTNESDVALRSTCTKAVVAVLNDGILKHKTICLMYFRKYMKLIRRIDYATEKIILNVLYYSHQTLLRVPLWLNGEDVKPEDVESFKMALLDVFNKYNEFNGLYDNYTKNHDKICSFSIRIIESLVKIKDKEVKLKKNLINAIVIFIKSFQSFKLEDCHILRECLKQFPDVIILLETKMLEEMPNLRCIWKDIYEQALNNDSSELEVTNQAFISITNVLQLYKMKINSKVDDFNIFDGEMSTILGRLFEKGQSRDLCANEFINIMEIFACAINIEEFGKLDASFQMKIVLFIIAPFSSSDSNIPIAIRKLFISNIFSDNEIKECKSKSLEVMSSMSFEHFKEENKVVIEQKMWSTLEDIVSSNEVVLQKELIKNLLNLILSAKYQVRKIFIGIIGKVIENPRIYLELTEIFQDLTCLLSPHSYIIQMRNNGLRCKYKIICTLCNEKYKAINISESEIVAMSQGNGVLVANEPYKNFDSLKKSGRYFLMWLQSKDDPVKINMINMLRSLILHTGFGTTENIVEIWRKFMEVANLDILKAFSKNIQQVLGAIEVTITDKEAKIKILDKCLESFLEATRLSLRTTEYSYQQCVVNMIFKFASYELLPEEYLMQCFRLMFFFIMRIESVVARDAEIFATEMCYRRNITPRNLLNWYRQPILKLIVGQMVTNYRLHSIALDKSLNHITKMLGFDIYAEFVNAYHRNIIAMLLPWIIMDKSCISILNDICEIIRLKNPVALSNSFLTIYPYLYINESDETMNKCIDMIIQNTGDTLYNLLQTDIRKIASEILIHYHKNPECVMRAMKSLITPGENADITTSQVTEYISTRFLGVLAFFEGTIFNYGKEKCVRRETLLSLAEIIRLLGSDYITSFRYKILATLKTILLSIEEMNLRDICIKVWKIFICTVDVGQLGNLLSTIFVTLQPFLPIYPDEINEIFKYLVVSNCSLLGDHIGSLFFIDETDICDDVKNVVKSQIREEQKDFINRFQVLFQHINHENLSIRIFGLKYLNRLFIENRSELNRLIIGQIDIDPMIEQILTNLIRSCRGVDLNYQLRSSECLGEIGAIAASHLPPKYSRQTKFSLTVHCDEFAIMALEELCRAYQKDTKNVDAYSLAIQDILSERKVSPRDDKGVEVWEAIPERLRPLMEPLLESCYTTWYKGLSFSSHPIFGNSKISSCHMWAYHWSSLLIQMMENETSRQLFDSFQPSMKVDIDILNLFLPYTLLHALVSTTQKNKMLILSELEHIFRAVIQDQGNEKTFSVNSKDAQRILAIRTVQSEIANVTEPQIESQSMKVKCAKIAFNLIDFLEKWRRKHRITNSNGGIAQPEQNDDYLIVVSFLELFDKKMLAEANFHCREYARALMYLEAYINNNSSKIQEEASFLATIYAKLNEPDSVDGVMAMKVDEPTLSEQIIANSASGRYNELATCYERLLQVGEMSTVDIQNYVDCYLALDQPETALLIAESLLNKFPDATDIDSQLEEISAEPLWRLAGMRSQDGNTRQGLFDELDQLVKKENVCNSENWGVLAGQLITHFRKHDHVDFISNLSKTRSVILKCMKSCDMEESTYDKAYPHVIKLHMITEFEKFEDLLQEIRENDEKFGKKALKKLIKDLESRLAILQPNSKTIEPVLCLRRILLNEIKDQIENDELALRINNHIGELWVKSTELASKAKMFQQAHIYVLNAEAYKPKNLFLSKAKLFWEKNDTAAALRILDRGLSDLLTSANITNVSNLDNENRAIFAEGKLLVAMYNAETSNMAAEMNIRYFKQAVDAKPDCEKSLVQLAEYIDKTYSSLEESEQNKESGWDMLVDIVKYYGKSMIFGSNYIFQSMPRMLSIWLDFTGLHFTKDCDEKKKITDIIIFNKYCQKINGLIQNYGEHLSSFFFFTAFSQIISRIAHPFGETFKVLKTIIVKMIVNYAPQAIWMMLCVIKSSYTNRYKRAAEILSDKRLQDPKLQKMIRDLNSVADQMISLTNREIKTQADIKNLTTVSSIVKSLPQLLTNPTLSEILMPIEKCLKLVLDRSSTDFKSFPPNLIFIRGIREKVSYLSSLQRPKRIILVGSDGKEYTMLLKPKDDLRKDFRLMEFNAVVKQHLREDPESRQRRLNIRTYAVTPLNEECGIIEWVANVLTYRSINLGYYKMRGLSMSSKALKEKFPTKNEPLERKIQVFNELYLKCHPPVFQEWFQDTFSNPHNWFQARSSYIKTTAVYSMVGYILGLGDRHGENIMMDASNGDTVHVDFNCLFNKGDSFDFPEMVPFRLTRNMVHAMGPLGYEGMFRKCCEIALRVLENQSVTLMAVLKPFVYDPLVSWNRDKKKKDVKEQTEQTDDEASRNLRNIQDRLKGYLRINKKRTNMPLSIEGQVNNLISEAVSLENNAVMWVGWGAFL